ncbi:MAG: hypothetical protein M3321_04510, partial [Actinomycetota bacterium]|nr:hypothetical protein [Actinomycetota bacterium]
MAGTVSWERLRELAGFRVAKGCAISLYLNLDPSTTATAGELSTRINSLLDEAEKTYAAKRPDLGHDERQGLRADFERLRSYFANDFSRDGARGFAIFAAGMDNFWRTLSLLEPVPDEVKVGPDLYLAPLVPLVGRGDGAIVAVVGREQGELYRLRGGRLEEIADRFDEQPRRHDQGGWSQARYQRHIDKLVHDHLRGVADDLDRRIRATPAAKVVVVASEETRAEFSEILSNEARNAVVGWTQAEAHAGPADLLEIAAPLLEQAHADG